MCGLELPTINRVQAVLSMVDLTTPRSVMRAAARCRALGIIGATATMPIRAEPQRAGNADNSGM
jgi:hypothetical protein